MGLLDDLKRQADDRFRAKERELEAQLNETEQRLTELQSAKAEGGNAMLLSPEQQAELLRFQEEKLRIRKELRQVRRQLDDYFEGTRMRFELRLDRRLIVGFQDATLRATQRVRYGHTTTYGELARRIGSPRAARAIGNALGANPLPIVIPCHRVLRSGGELGGYGGGLARKELLLELEGVLPGGPRAR